MATFISVFAILEFFALFNYSSHIKVSAKSNHNATYDTVLLIAFQMVRIISQTFFIQRFSFL